MPHLPPQPVKSRITAKVVNEVRKISAVVEAPADGMEEERSDEEHYVQSAVIGKAVREQELVPNPTINNAVSYDLTSQHMIEPPAAIPPNILDVIEKDKQQKVALISGQVHGSAVQQTKPSSVAAYNPAAYGESNAEAEVIDMENNGERAFHAILVYLFTF